MLFMTLGDIAGLILLVAVAGYIIYLCSWSAIDDYKKRKPYLDEEREKAKARAEKEKVAHGEDKTDPKTAKALIILGIFFALGIATAIWAASK